MRPSWSPDQGLAPYSCPRWLSPVASRGALSYVIFVPLPSSSMSLSLSSTPVLICPSSSAPPSTVPRSHRSCRRRPNSPPRDACFPPVGQPRLLFPSLLSRSSSKVSNSSPSVIHPSIHPSHHSCQQQDLSTHSPSTGKSSNSSSSSSCAALFWVGRGFSVELEVAALADAAAGAAFAALSGAPGMMSCRDVKWVGGF